MTGKAVHTLSTGRDAVGNALGLAWGTNGDILELGPREVLLPKVKPRREASTSHRGVFMRYDLLSAALSPDLTNVPPSRRAGYVRPSPETCQTAMVCNGAWRKSWRAAMVGGWPANGLVRSLVGAGGRIGLRRSATRAAVGQRYGCRPSLERGSVFFRNSRVLSGDKLRGFGGCHATPGLSV